MKKAKNEERSTWAIPNFPKVLRQRFAAACKSNGTSIREHLEDVVKTELRRLGFKVESFEKK